MRCNWLRDKVREWLGVDEDVEAIKKDATRRSVDLMDAIGRVASEMEANYVKHNTDTFFVEKSSALIPNDRGGYTRVVGIRMLTRTDIEALERGATQSVAPLPRSW